MTHVEGDVNPVRDLDIIGEELRLKDEETLTKNLEKLERVVGRGTDKKLKPEYVSVKFEATHVVPFSNKHNSNKNFNDCFQTEKFHKLLWYIKKRRTIVRVYWR